MGVFASSSLDGLPLHQYQFAEEAASSMVRHEENNMNFIEEGEEEKDGDFVEVLPDESFVNVKRDVRKFSFKCIRVYLNGA